MKTDPAGIPSVDRIIHHVEIANLISNFGHSLVVDETRFVLGKIREEVLRGGSIPEMDSVIQRISDRLTTLIQSNTVPVINATGVILHTNLGRSPLSTNAVNAITRISEGYSTLEFDLQSGSRGKRTTHIETLFRKLLGIEEALVVNNNAAAVLLILSALASRKKVIISRGQLVEIGGGVRIPDVLKMSGARLIEIGTTNQVHPDDYEKAIRDGGNLILFVHPSNFRISGYTSEPSLEEIVRIGHQHGIPVVEDLGSGALLDTSIYGMAHEPTIQESISTGVDVVCFSGDKLFGGPQAGCILGKSVYLQRIKKHPLARVVRSDKTLVSSLEATLLSYIQNRALEEIPVWKMINATIESLRSRIENWIKQTGFGEILDGKSTVGGGSMPEEEMPTVLMTIRVEKPDQFLQILREQDTAVIARIQEGLICLDPRTVMPDQDSILVSCISRSMELYKRRLLL